jgi:hypothetical protein
MRRRRRKRKEDAKNALVEIRSPVPSFVLLLPL